MSKAVLKSLDKNLLKEITIKKQIIEENKSWSIRTMSQKLSNHFSDLKNIIFVNCRTLKTKKRKSQQSKDTQM